MRHASNTIIATSGIAFLAAHAGTLALAGDRAMAVSFAWLIAAPLVAGLACLHQGWKDRLEGWLCLGTAMLCWSGGMAATMVATLFLDVAGEQRLSMLLYVLYGVPLIFALASPDDETWPVRLVDAALAAALGWLFYVHVSRLSTGLDTGIGAGLGTGEADATALRLMFDIENGFIALFAILRFLASPGRHNGFSRALAFYATAYMACAGYMNHFESESDFGLWPDLIIDVPFVLLAWLALEAGFPRARTVQAPRAFVRIVRAGSPTLLPVTLLTVSVLLVSHDARMAITGCIAASVGYGLRTVLIQLRNFEEQEQLVLLSHVDALTGIPNRRRFDEVLQREWSRRVKAQERTPGKPATDLALLMIDIDHFKQLNDHFGHATGDERLRDVALALTACARREDDLVARYGGEEFCAILTDADARDALAIAERMRATVESLALPLGRGASAVTVSIGVACARTLDTDIDAFVASADAALYDAKRNGRNQVAQRTAPPLRSVTPTRPTRDGKAA